MTVTHTRHHSPTSSFTHPPFLKVIVAGKGKTIASRNVIEKCLQLSCKKRPNVAYFGTACMDREIQYKSLAIPYEEAGCHVTKVDLWDKENMNGSQTTSPGSVAEIIQRADIILLSGGSMCVAMKKWRQYGIDEILIHAAYRPNPPIFVGGSAGALCLAYRGLQLLPLALVPHYDTLTTHKVVKPHRIFERDPRIPCIGLDENAAWLIHGHETLALSQDGSALCYHVYCQGGRIESSNLPLNETIPLASFGISIGPTS